MSKLGKLLCAVGLSVVSLVTFNGIAHADDDYENCGSTEPTWQNHANFLWCDDAERGRKVVDGTWTTNPDNGGWEWTPFADLDDPAEAGFARCGTAVADAIVVGGTPGYRGTNCAFTSGNMTSTETSGGESQADSQSSHPIPAVNELHYRFFFRCIKTTQNTFYSPAITGCSWSENTKFSPTLNGDGQGGIDFGNVAMDDENEDVGTGRCNVGAGHPSGCQIGKLGMSVQNEGSRKLAQTMLNAYNGDGTVTANNCTPGYICFVRGDYNGWYYYEIYIKLASDGTGIWRQWIAECGTDGTECDSADPETDYLRTEYTDVDWCPGASSGGCTINTIWDQLYSSGNGESTPFYVLNGEWYQDQYMALSGDTFIGPSIESAGGGGPDVTPPAAPTGITIAKAKK